MVGDELRDGGPVDVVAVVPARAVPLHDRAAAAALEERVVQPRAVDEGHDLRRHQHRELAAEAGAPPGLSHNATVDIRAAAPVLGGLESYNY